MCPPSVSTLQAKLKDLRRAASDAGVQGLALPLAAVSTGGQGRPAGAGAGAEQGFAERSAVQFEVATSTRSQPQGAKLSDCFPAVGEFRQLAVWAQEDPTRLDQVGAGWHCQW